MENYYEKKYLKYKNKYLALKQYGGMLSKIGSAVGKVGSVVGTVVNDAVGNVKKLIENITNIDNKNNSNEEKELKIKNAYNNLSKENKEKLTKLSLKHKILSDDYKKTRAEVETLINNYNVDLNNFTANAEHWKKLKENEKILLDNVNERTEINTQRLQLLNR
jgi:hypothetical protein